MIFIDTGAFIARYVTRDHHHRRATEIWNRFRKVPPRLFTSNTVLDETFTLLARRTRYDFAAGKARSLLASRHLTILRSGQPEEHEAVALFEKYADQEVSFTDCISFVLMRKERIKRAFGFDRHFRDAGFELLS